MSQTLWQLSGDDGVTYYREKDVTKALAKMRKRGINDVPGLYKGEAAFLRKMARKAPDGAALEIGVRFGYSILQWGQERVGRGRIIGIELVDRPLLRENIRKSGIHVEMLIGDSGKLPLFASPLAFLFIDGDHREPGLLRDINRYIPFVIPDGIVVFHDYRHNRKQYPDVRVTECVRAWRLRNGWPKLGRVRHAIAFQRPE